MLSRHTFILSTLILAFSAQVQAQIAPTFVGCVLFAEAVLTGNSAGRVASQTACNTRCNAGNYQFSYYAAGVAAVPPLIIGENCYCDNVGSYIAASAYAVGSGTSGQSCLGLGVQATAMDLKTTFQFQGCTNTITGVVINLLQGTILGGSLVSDPQACFAQCKGNLNAYFIPIVPSVTAILPSYGCVCDPSGPGQSSICGIGQFFKYGHSATASQLQQAKKRQLLENAKNEKRKSFCPKKMTSCLIPGVEDSWECIDPQSDLESCGGCVSGEYTSEGTSNSNATGIDCTNMPGVLRGGSTCTNGECVAFACKRKWTLKNGKCVRSRVQ